MRSVEPLISSQSSAQRIENNNSNAFGHLKFLKNKHSNFLDKDADDEEVEKTKSILARIQGD